MIRIFVSFASPSLPFAEKLHDGLTKRNATVFQFDRSARAGSNAWDQVYDNIQDADYFVCLLSREAIKSRPVQKEVGYADYCNTNNDDRPKLVPILLDPIEPTKWPKPLQVLTPLDISELVDSEDYAEGVSRIARELELHELEVLQRVEGDEAEERVGHSRNLAADSVVLRMQGLPETSEAPSTVKWEIEVENAGASNIEALRVTLDGQEVEEPFFIAAGETKRFTKSSRYKAPGPKTRRLRAHVISEDGPVHAGELDVRIEVASPSPKTAENGRIEKAEPSDAEVRARLDSAGSDFAWDAVIFPLLVLVLGAGATWGTVYLSPIVVGVAGELVRAYPVDAFLTFPLDILNWIGASGWFPWISGLFAAGLIGIISFAIAEEEFPIDAAEYGLVTLRSAFTALLVSGVWCVAHIQAFSPDTLSMVMGGAVALSSIVVAIYAFLFEIDF